MTTTRTRSDKKREAIISAARQAFQEFGVIGTSMDKLAEMASVSKRTVYNHFSAKEELVMHIVKEQFQNALVDIDVAYDTQASLQSQLESLIMEEINFVSADEHLDLARVVVGHFFYEPEKLKDARRHLCEKELALLV